MFCKGKARMRRTTNSKLGSRPLGNVQRPYMDRSGTSLTPSDKAKKKTSTSALNAVRPKMSMHTPWERMQRRRQLSFRPVLVWAPNTWRFKRTQAFPLKRARNWKIISTVSLSSFSSVLSAETYIRAPFFTCREHTFQPWRLVFPLGQPRQWNCPDRLAQLLEQFRRSA